MIERIARAIKDARALPGTNPVARLSDVDRRAARAAIGAMREPSEILVEAGADAFADEYGSAPLDPSDDKAAAVAIYRAMIDAAIPPVEKG